MNQMILARHDFLKLIGISAVTGLTASLWQDTPLHGDIFVCVFQRGGMDGLNAVIPYGDPGYFRLRPSLAIAEPKTGSKKTAIDLDGFFGLHPSLFPLKSIWDEQALAIIHAVGSPDPTHSHFDAMDFMEYGYPGNKNVKTGWLARHLESSGNENKSLVRAISVGTMVASSLHGSVPALALSRLDEFQLGREDNIPISSQKFRTTLSSLYSLGLPIDQAAGLTFQAAEILNGISVKTGTSADSVQYPQSQFGQSLRLIGQLIKSEVGLQVATVDIPGWDTHINQGAIEGQMPRLLLDLSQSLSAFYRDMAEEMKRITVVVMSEFGRRVAENSGGGTDHGHGNVMFLMGKNIKGGKVYGQWPGLAHENLDGPGDLAVTTDFRTVLAEIVQKRLMNGEIAKVFPAFPPTNFLGLAH